MASIADQLVELMGVNRPPAQDAGPLAGQPQPSDFGNILGLPTSQVVDWFKKHEGSRMANGMHVPYTDDAGHRTIGYGHKIKSGESFGPGLSESGALALLHRDITERLPQVAQKFDENVDQPGAFDQLPPQAKLGLLDVEYNPGLHRFPKLSRAVWKAHNDVRSGDSPNFDPINKNITDRNFKQVDPDTGKPAVDESGQFKKVFLNRRNNAVAELFREGFEPEESIGFAQEFGANGVFGG